MPRTRHISQIEVQALGKDVGVGAKLNHRMESVQFGLTFVSAV